MANKFKLGARVQYKAQINGVWAFWPGLGTVVEIVSRRGEPTKYYVKWNSVDYTKPVVLNGVSADKPPLPAWYHSGDLALASTRQR
jgi:hypothetical protein